MKRTPLVRRTPLRQVSLKRTGIRSTVRYTGPDRDTVDAVLERDGHACAIGSHAISGVRGVDWHLHHRKPRRAGGTTAPDINLPSNLLTLCPACHDLVESRRSAAYERGWLLHAGDVPSQVPVLHSLPGWTYLTDVGGFSQATPPVNRGGEIDFGNYWRDEDGVA